MLETYRKYKMPIIIVAGLIVAFIIYSYFFTGKSTNDSAVLTSTADTASNSQVGQAFVNQLLTLQNVNLNDKVFSDPRFQSLIDRSQPIPDEPIGRPNPFAPIGFDVLNGPTITPAGGNSSSNINFSTQGSTSTNKK